jgi:hypothetical protein
MDENSAVEFCGVRFDGSRYAEAVFNVGGLCYDILGILFLDALAKPDDSGRASFELSGRIRYHVDDKHFDSDDTREWFRFSIKTATTPKEAVARTVTAFQFLSIKAASRAATMGLADRDQALLIALAGDVLVLSVESAEPNALMAAVALLPGTRARKATPEEIAEWTEAEKMELN